MGDYLRCWRDILIGGVIYQIGRAALGFDLTIGTLIDATYWTGAALLLHWLWNRPRSSADRRE